MSFFSKLKTVAWNSGMPVSFVYDMVVSEARIMGLMQVTRGGIFLVS
jgi:hypothetical protein